MCNVNTLHQRQSMAGAISVTVGICLKSADRSKLYTNAERCVWHEIDEVGKM